MNKQQAEKVQALLMRMTAYQQEFVAKHGASPSGGMTPGAYNAQFAMAMMEAGRTLWPEGLAGVALPLDLSGVDFTAGVLAGYGDELNRASFKEARLDRTRWFGLHVKHADFTGASLRDAFLGAVFCEGSTFRGADLSGARLGMIAIDAPADFTGANLSGAQLILGSPLRAIFTDARVDGLRVTAGEIGPQTKEAVDGFRACLSEAQLRQVRIEISQEDLERSRKMKEDLVNGRASKKGGCFIATAACGSEGHADVLRLRAFRDAVLARTWFGRALVALYERVSPPVADWIRPREEARRRVRRWLVGPAARLLAPRGSSRG
jgi:hypothetical protein